MSKTCECGSAAINPHAHGRESGADLHLCDVCYWRTRANANALDAARWRTIRELVWDGYSEYYIHAIGDSAEDVDSHIDEIRKGKKP